MTSPQTRRFRNERGFTLIELLVTMAITTVILGATMMAMSEASKAAESAQQITDLNSGLRTAMDLIVRDLLQVGQGLPGGREILVPNGANSTLIRVPGPAGSNYTLNGIAFCPPRPPDDNDTVCEEIQAVVPGPGRGPVLTAGQPATDMITTLAADSAFDHVRLTAFAADGRSIVVALPGTVAPRHPNGRDISDDPDVGGDNIRPGDLIMLTKGASSALVQVSNVVGQTVSFAGGDSLNLNQSAAADGTSTELRATAPADTPPVAPNAWVNTEATRIRMIGYYIDNTTDPRRPRLVRRINNGPWNTFNNTAGTAVAFDIENLQISYDLVDGVNNPANVRMNNADHNGTGACAPSPCYASQIRKINLLLAGRSRQPRKGTNQFYRARLQTQVSLRSLAFVDRYR